MTQVRTAPLVLQSRHTGEILALTRFEDESGPWLEIRGSLPPHREGPPLHIHHHEDEGGRVLAGTISAIIGDQTVRVGAGGEVILPRGQPHRWWNDGDVTLEFEGYARPVVDLDRMLQAMFEVANAGPPGRPSLFYMAHVLHRHRRSQLALVMPRLLQAVLFPVVIGVGHLLGRYRGTSWPGCPSRCPGAPAAGRREG